MAFPSGYGLHTGNIGIKDRTEHVMILSSPPGTTAAGVFTKRRFSGPSVTLSRHHVADGRSRAVVILSKNANVATGAVGDANAVEVAELTARVVGCNTREVIIASTGVIGVRYPMDRIRAYMRRLEASSRHAFDEPGSATAAASAIMTTDTHAKVAGARAGTARVVGIAKGVGMIEPDMATMLAVVTTDALVDPTSLDAMFRRVVDRTFNALSIDTDTSTSDMAVVLASGRAGPVNQAALEAALDEVCLDLTRQLAADGEGAETLIVVTVDGARDNAQAKRVAKSIVNSPLVKTAVHGRDPNWGRVAMAVGKCYEDDILAERVTIRFGRTEVYPAPVTSLVLEKLERYLASPEVLIHVNLGVPGAGSDSLGAGTFTVYGCDLTDGYVRINADYTT
ncbi:MAG: bifunctional glutamate N-acetyltransferase/amino-acid acetyltransferase ArgJ [Acidimicrobiia bacterium]|nr:bifunctional glutamate N-acetyltransferase/amino-acid acetyltransferase ArgJ [Acidimicrobiia bacterium]